MKEYIRLLRPKHSIKNLLVLFPLVFSGRLLETELLFRALCAVLAFCIVASLVYILNDIRDVERDRQHPTKCRRPIASGAVPVSHAAAEGAVLCLVLVFLFWVGRFPWKSGLCLGLYFIINLDEIVKLPAVYRRYKKYAWLKDLTVEPRQEQG